MVAVRIIVGTLALQVAVPPFGGEPPWGLEQPTRISGEVRHGERFERPIAGGLYFGSSRTRRVDGGSR
jgi:hypothetical protein